MMKIFKQYGNKEDIYFPIVNCFDIKDNMYEINPDTSIIRRIDTKYVLSQTYDSQTGYYRIGLSNKLNKTGRYFVHRIVAKMFCFEYEGKNIVNHINGIKNDNRYTNLEWCTAKENVQHAIRLGLTRHRGSNNSHSILTDDQVHEICKLMCENISYSEILCRVGIPVQENFLKILSQIRGKRLWKWISDLYPIPEPEFRSPMIQYDDESIHEVCRMISNGNSITDIGLFLGVDLQDKKSYDRFYKFLSRLKKRKSYDYITKYYNW